MIPGYHGVLSKIVSTFLKPVPTGCSYVFIEGTLLSKMFSFFLSPLICYRAMECVLIQC